MLMNGVSRSVIACPVVVDLLMLVGVCVFVIFYSLIHLENGRVIV